MRRGSVGVAWDRLARRGGRAAATGSEGGAGGASADGEGDDGRERLLALERDCQALRLELGEERAALARLRGDVARERGEAAGRVAEAGRARVAGVLAGAASAVQQLVTQAHLVEVERRGPAVGDVVAVASRLVRALEAGGLERVGGVGERAAFDRAAHEPLDVAAALAPGAAVVIRFVGIAFDGELLRKAGVEPAPEPVPERGA